MQMLLLAGLLLLATLLVVTWRSRRKYAKATFSLFAIALILQGAIGARHAWGESGSYPWTFGWIVFAITFVLLTYARVRRP